MFWQLMLTIYYRMMCVLRQIWLRKKATIHLVTTVLATSKIVLFPSPNHLLTTGADDRHFDYRLSASRLPCKLPLLQCAVGTYKIYSRHQGWRNTFTAADLYQIWTLKKRAFLHTLIPMVVILSMECCITSQAPDYEMENIWLWDFMFLTLFLWHFHVFIYLMNKACFIT